MVIVAVYYGIKLLINFKKGTQEFREVLSTQSDLSNAWIFKGTSILEIILICASICTIFVLFLGFHWLTLVFSAILVLIALSYLVTTRYKIIRWGNKAFTSNVWNNPMSIEDITGFEFKKDSICIHTIHYRNAREFKRTKLLKPCWQKFEQDLVEIAKVHAHVNVTDNR